MTEENLCSRLTTVKSLHEAATAEEVKQRITLLGPSNERAWGKMNAPQMLGHCSAALEMASGDTVLPRVFIGRLIGPLFRTQYSNEKPFSKNLPTAPGLVVGDERDLARERDRLISLVDRFSQGGPGACTKASHCFFGPLTGEEWGKGMYKHLDHHLRQFNA